MKNHIIRAAAVTLAIGTAGQAAAMSNAVDACIEKIMEVGGPDAQNGGEVLDTSWSQAGTLLHLRDAGGSVWECIGYDDGTVGDLRVVSAADDGKGAMAPRGYAADREPGTSTETVRFHKGIRAQPSSGHLVPGASHRYILGAKDGQMLYVTVNHDHAKAEYQIFNPDGSFLLDLIDSRHPYQGQLWQSGNHVVEVVNRGSHRVKFEFR